MPLCVVSERPTKESRDTMHTVSEGLIRMMRAWALRHGRELALSLLAGATAALPARQLDGVPGALAGITAWALLGVLPAVRLLEISGTTADAIRRGPGGTDGPRWRAALVAVAGCAGSLALLQGIVVTRWALGGTLVPARIPLLLALGFGLGVLLHALLSRFRRR